MQQKEIEKKHAGGANVRLRSVKKSKKSAVSGILIWISRRTIGFDF